MVDFFYRYGLVGLFLAAFLSGSVFPFNSEVVLTFMVYNGFSVTSSIVAATAGNTLGGVSIYYLGYLGKMEWIEKYAKVEEKKIHAILPKLQKYGPLTATLSFVPIIGDVIILGLGFFRISPWMTLIYMTIGKVIRYMIIAGAIKMIF